MLGADAMQPASAQDELFLLMYIAHPAPGSDEFGRIGGAFVVCLMDLPSKSAAHQRAVETIEAKGWTAASLEAAEVVQRDDVDEERKPYFDQALIDKEVIVFYPWMIDAPDAGRG